jgi:flagellar protein FliS
MTTNVAAAYQDNKVMTASPAELTLMLYEGIIKFCNIAMLANEKKDIAKAHLNIIKAENIIMELKSTLDFNYPVAKELDLLYEYLNTRLTEANLKKDNEILEEVLYFARELRDTWKEAMKLVS